MTEKMSLPKAIITATTPKRVLEIVKDHAAVAAAPTGIYLASAYMGASLVSPLAAVAGLVGVGAAGLISVSKALDLVDDGTNAAEADFGNTSIPEPVTGIGQFAAAVRSYRKPEAQSAPTIKNKF